jgi:hypothetical protein
MNVSIKKIYKKKASENVSGKCKQMLQFGGQVFLLISCLICPFRDLSGNPLICDCELGWLLEWAQNMSVKLTSSPKCGGPPTLRGQPIRKLQLGTDLHCNWPAAGSSHGTLLELKPAHSQVWKQILVMRLAVLLLQLVGFGPSWFLYSLQGWENPVSGMFYSHCWWPANAIRPVVQSEFWTVVGTLCVHNSQVFTLAQVRGN